MTVGPPRSALTRRRLLERIELLCDCGAGLEAIASPLTHAIRDYLGCASGALFWVDAAGNPGGFYHDCAPAEVKDLFITRLDELFLAPGETNMMTLLHATGPSIGSTLEPGYQEHFWSGNVYRYLCKPLGHRWILDMRIVVGGIGRALFCAWHTPERQFSNADVVALQPVQRAMERAVARQRVDVAWRSINQGAGHLTTDATGTRLLAINVDAERVLMSSHLLRQQVSMTEAPRIAPGFATLLAQMLAVGAEPVTYLPVADGRIVARASAMRAVGNADSGTVMISLDHQVAVDALLVDRLIALPLTPLQRRIALFAMHGGRRSACGAAMGVGDEALKKHTRTVLDATGVAKWADLPAFAAAIITN